MTSSTTTTSISRGDVVVVGWPDKYTRILKARPGIVVQSDAFVSEDDFLVLVSLTSQISRPTLNCRIPVLSGSSEFRAMSLTRDSLILPDKLLHIHPSEIVRQIGRCPTSVMWNIETSLRLVLDL